MADMSSTRRGIRGAIAAPAATELPFIPPDDMPDLYAAPGTGDCMVPLLPADALLAFDKRAPVEPGDVVVLWFTPAAARRMGVLGWVKRLRQPLPPAGTIGLITVEMLNPQRTLTLRSDDVVAIHKCIGEAERTSRGTVVAQAVSLRAIPGSIAVEPRIEEGLRLELFERPHPATTVHAVHDNRHAPLIRAGEIVVVEGNGKSGWLPVDGGLFLIEYVSKGQALYDRERRTREVVQTYRNARGDWYAGPMRRGQVGGVIHCSDGPYRDEQVLADQLIGRVVGILSSSMEGRA